MNTRITLPTMRELCSPTQVPESGQSERETLERLRLALEHGDEQTRATAQEYVHALMLKAIAGRLFAGRHGPVSVFREQIERSVQSFEKALR